jgi:uncharacterized RDD family membrane protein YckC
MAEATYAGFWIRALAYAADMAILTLVLLLLALPFAFMGGAGMALYGLIAAVGPIAYFAWLQASSREATIGKQLCGLKVRHEGEQISLLRSIARELAKLLSSAVLMIGFLMVAFTGRKQGLHDMLASTEVVREGPARVMIAILVALAGVLIPVFVIPLMFGAMFAGMMAMMMGGAMEQSVRQSKPVPRLEQKVANRAPAPAAQPAPRPSATPSAASAAKPAANDPESVYQNFHAATLAGDFDGLRQWGTKQAGDELAAASAAERKVMLGLMANLLPKTYKVTGSEVSADGGKAQLRLRAETTHQGGKTEIALGTAVLVKENGAWKVDKSIWGGEQPPSLASQGAAPAKPSTPEAPKPMAAEPPKPMAAAQPAPTVAPDVEAPPRASARQAASKRSEAAAPAVLKSKPPCVYKPVMTDEEIDRCR